MEIQTILSTFLEITQESPMGDSWVIPSVTSLTDRSVLTLSCCDLELPQLMSLYKEATLSEITKHAAGISKEYAWLLLIKLDHQFT